jgi:hypothetical protein
MQNGFMDVQAGFNGMVDWYASGSNRAAGILATSFLDNLLETLLLAHLVDDQKVRDLFEGDRPLATFSARISLAFAIGYIPPNVYADLSLLRKIRNHFAHSAEQVSFEDGRIRDWCGALSTVRKDSPMLVKLVADSKAREQFLFTIGGITVYIEGFLNGLRNGPLQRCIAPATGPVEGIGRCPQVGSR